MCGGERQAQKHKRECLNVHNVKLSKAMKYFIHPHLLAFISTSVLYSFVHFLIRGIFWSKYQNTFENEYFVTAKIENTLNQIYKNKVLTVSSSRKRSDL